MQIDKIMNEKTVCVALPVFNGEKYIDKAIQSLLLQDYKNIRIFIRDDASDDDTPNICKKYSEKYENIFFDQNDVNLGGQDNLLKILNDIDSDYFLWASQDDFWESKFISSLVKILDDNPQHSLAFCQTRMISKEKNYIIKLTGRNLLNKLSSYKLVTALLLPTRHLRYLKTNLVIHGLVRTQVMRDIFLNLIGVANHDRIIVLFTILNGTWGYLDQTLYNRNKDTGATHREQKKEDQIRLAQKGAFVPFISAYKMYVGVYKAEHGSFLLKAYIYLVIPLYVIMNYTLSAKSYASLFLYSVLPKKYFFKMRRFYRIFFKN